MPKFAEEDRGQEDPDDRRQVVEDLPPRLPLQPQEEDRDHQDHGHDADRVGEERLLVHVAGGYYTRPGIRSCAPCRRPARRTVERRQRSPGRPPPAALRGPPPARRPRRTRRQTGSPGRERPNGAAAKPASPSGRQSSRSVSVSTSTSRGQNAEASWLASIRLSPDGTSK